MNQLIEQIKKEVFFRRPVLKEIIEQHSKQILNGYIKSAWELAQEKPDALFLDCFKAVLKKIHGPKIAEQAERQLVNKPLVSTIDHHGIWNHPIFLNSSVIYSLYFNSDELVLTLPTESVSLNNVSSRSACLLEHGNDGRLNRYSFFPDRLKTRPVFSTPAINKESLGKLQDKAPAHLYDLLAVLKIREVLGLENFSWQACRLSYDFWQTVFPSAPKLIYLPLESLISNYFLRLFEDPQHWLTRLVFTPKGRQLWQRYFPAEQTFMFWGIDKKGRRQKLSSLPNSPAELILRIKNREIYPGSVLCFAVLLNAGMACVGGFTQTTWLSQTKVKLLSLLIEFNDVDRSTGAKIAAIPTKNFAESSLVWLKLNQGFIMPTGVDLYLTGKDYYPFFTKLSKIITLGRSLDLMLPTIYSVVVPKADWLESFDLAGLEESIFTSASMEGLLAKLDNPVLIKA